MHSNRMCTACFSGGVYIGGVYPGGSVGGYLPWGVSTQGWQRYVNPPQVDQPLPVDRMTDACENITFSNFVCGR